MAKIKSAEHAEGSKKEEKRNSQKANEIKKSKIKKQKSVIFNSCPNIIASIAA
jgi:hypothetical protein